MAPELSQALAKGKAEQQLQRMDKADLFAIGMLLLETATLWPLPTAISRTLIRLLLQVITVTFIAIN